MPIPPYDTFGLIFQVNCKDGLIRPLLQAQQVTLEQDERFYETPPSRFSQR